MGQLSRNSNLLHEINEIERRILQNTLLDMLSDLTNGCREIGVKFFLCGGSALGAIRHQGFIPWDDDVDVAMFREDWEAFKKNFECYFAEKYVLEAPCYGNKDTKTTWGKMYKKNTELVEIQDINAPYCKGVFIDIFIIENISDNWIVRKIDGLVSDFMKGVATSMVYYKYPNELMAKYMSSTIETKVYFSARRLLGFIFSFISHKEWCSLFDKFVSRHKQKSKLIAIPTGRRNYKGEILPRDVWGEGRLSQFESIKTWIPEKCKTHLECLYGKNYMELPPIEDREKHFVVSYNL